MQRLVFLLVFMCECKNMFVFISKNITCGNAGSCMNLCSQLCVFRFPTMSVCVWASLVYACEHTNICLRLIYIWKHIYVCHVWVFFFACPCLCMHVMPVCVHVCVSAPVCAFVCVEYDLRILRLIVAVFHIIDSERRYRQAKRRQLAAAPASGMGLWYDILCVSAQAINNSDTFLYAWESPWFSLP